MFNSHHAADLADLVRRLGEESRPRILGLLGAGLAAQTLAAADAATARTAASGLQEGTLAAIVSRMAPDAAADLLAELPPDLCGRLLEQMESGQAAEIEELLAHAEESCGGIMTSRLIAVRDSFTVSESVHYLREWAGDEEILSLFVVDDDGRLTGTLSLRCLLLAEPETVIEDLVEPDPISVQVDVDQEEIARIFAEYDLLAVPVVEEGGSSSDKVTVDDIVDVIRDEATEDIDEMAAMSSEEIGERSTFAVMRRRLPWLLLCLAGTLVCGAVIDRFEDLLSRLGALILFVPAIMAMGGNSGIQTSTVTVRSLATEDFPQRNLLHVVWRELRTALGMGLFLGLLVGGVARDVDGGRGRRRLRGHCHGRGDHPVGAAGRGGATVVPSPRNRSRGFVRAADHHPQRRPVAGDLLRHRRGGSADLELMPGTAEGTDRPGQWTSGLPSWLPGPGNGPNPVCGQGGMG